MTGKADFTAEEWDAIAEGPTSAGMIGTVSDLPAVMSTLPSGLRAPAAEVKLENGETVLVPLVNLEVVG